MIKQISSSLSNPCFLPLSESEIFSILRDQKRLSNIKIIRTSGATYTGLFIRIKDNKLQLAQTTVINKHGGQQGSKNKMQRNFNLDSIASIEILSA